MSQEITKEQIAAFDADFSAQRANRVAMNAVTNNGLLASAIRREAVGRMSMNTPSAWSRARSATRSRAAAAGCLRPSTPCAIR